MQPKRCFNAQGQCLRHLAGQQNEAETVFYCTGAVFTPPRESAKCSRTGVLLHRGSVYATLGVSKMKPKRCFSAQGQCLRHLGGQQDEAETVFYCTGAVFTPPRGPAR